MTHEKENQAKFEQEFRNSINYLICSHDEEQLEELLDLLTKDPEAQPYEAPVVKAALKRALSLKSEGNYDAFRKKLLPGAKKSKKVILNAIRNYSEFSPLVKECLRRTRSIEWERVVLFMDFIADNDLGDLVDCLLDKPTRPVGKPGGRVDHADVERIRKMKDLLQSGHSIPAAATKVTEDEPHKPGGTLSSKAKRLERVFRRRQALRDIDD